MNIVIFTLLFFKASKAALFGHDAFKWTKICPFCRSKIVLFWEMALYIATGRFPSSAKTRRFHLSVPLASGMMWRRHKIFKWVRVIKVRAIPDVRKYLHCHINIRKNTNTKKEMDGCKSDKEATPVGVCATNRACWCWPLFNLACVRVCLCACKLGGRATVRQLLLHTRQPITWN